jgi:hypothetical protein
MNSLFPFELPFPTLFYLLLYVSTLLIHVVFMNYVLAGSGYVAIQTWIHRRDLSKLKEDKLTSHLKDWLPFILSAAITAGVAPLLFIQILYKESFYTANLLLFHRWMSMVPALIVGFYLLYVSKGKWLNYKMLPIFASMGAFLCFLFAAYSWTENHLLSKQPQKIWAEFYQLRSWTFWDPELLPRLGIWISGSVNTMCVILAWQLFWKQHFYNANFKNELSKLSKLSVGSIVLAIFLGGAYYFSVNEGTQILMNDKMVFPYILILGSGLLIQSVMWLLQGRIQKISAVYLSLISFGLLFSMIAVSMMREFIRIRSVHIEQFYQQHEDAMNVGGFWAFLLFTILNLAAVGIAVFLVKRFHLQRRSNS